MNITECFPMRKRRSIDKTPGRSHDTSALNRSPPVSKLRRTPRRFGGTSCNSSLLDQSLEIVWDNNSPSPTRTLSLGKRKKHHGSDSSSSGGEISDLVQKLADKSGSTPEANPPLLAFWMSRENNTTAQANNDNTAVKGNSASRQKIKEFQTPSRRPRRVLRKCNKSKMKLLKQDIELLVLPVEKTEEEAVRKETVTNSSQPQQESSENKEDVNTGVKVKGNESVDFFDGWGTDEDDLILSQVDIPVFKNTVPETQVMTNTQFLGSGGDAEQNNVTKQPSVAENHRTNANVDTNDSIVTESWDFVDELGDSDDDDILQNALEDIEKSQPVTIPTVRRVSHLYIKPDMSHITSAQKEEVSDKVSPLVQGDVTRSEDQFSRLQSNSIPQVQCTRKGNYSFVRHSSLQSSTTVQTKNPTMQQGNKLDVKNTNSFILPQMNLKRTVQQQANFQNIGKNTNQDTNIQNSSQGKRMEHGGSKTAKYSKDDIERKKLEAQNRRRQKMAQLSRHKH